MKIIALIGKSGTGKSYKAISLLKKLNIEYMIDDGLLIKGNRIIAGKSAKREDTSLGAVKRAIFMDESHRKEVIEAIKSENPDSILILGTSDKMVEKSVKALELPNISQKIYIEDVATEKEIKIAQIQRKKEGKHVIPVPTFEIKKDFSGYFIDALSVWKKKDGKKEKYCEKTVVRPTFSYRGKYTISNKVIKDLVGYASMKIDGVSRILNIYINNLEYGVKINIDCEIQYGSPIIPIVKKVQFQVIKEIEYMTSLNIIGVDVLVKKMTVL